jgi:peroxiredoxin
MEKDAVASRHLELAGTTRDNTQNGGPQQGGTSFSRSGGKVMKKKLARVVMAVALLPIVGCAKTEPTTSGTSARAPATRTSAEDTSAADPVAAPSTEIDREVVQTAATLEESAKPSGEIGASAPAWQNLEGTDGKQHSLTDLADAKAVAVVFTCNSCPVAIAYEDRLVQLANDYKDKGLALVAINVNNVEDDKLPAMKTRAEEKGFTFAYLYDPSQQIARDYGATVTPHAFLLDAQRKIVYEGAIDNSQDASAVTENYLREAIDATLASQQPTVASTDQFGCQIKYE